MNAFHEEIEEYKAAAVVGDLEGQMDALIDLLVFTLGACEKHGFNNIEEAFERVMTANMSKQVVTCAEESKRGHKFDLKKPEGWRAPYLWDLIEDQPYKGLVILEGPDGCGKTTLAEFLRDNYGAHIIHSTWSKTLEPRMLNYMEETLDQALEIAKNQLVVLDRHWLSELVYADVYRGGSSLQDYHQKAHDALKFHDVFTNVVYCLPHDLELARLHFDKMKAEREEMYTDITEVIQAYAALWEGSDLYAFKTQSQYIKRLNFTGGLKHASHINMRFRRYDWTTDGKNMEVFTNSNILMGVNS